MEWNDIVPGCVVDVPIKDAAGEVIYVDHVASLHCVPALFANLVTAALAFAGVTALFFIIAAGYKLIASGGDPKRVDSGRKTLIYALVGLALILLSFFIINLVSYVTGVGCVRQFGLTNC